MKKGRECSRQEIEEISGKAIGKTLNDILREEKLTIKDNEANKGGLGQLIEKYLFGIENNNNSEPDFMPAGIELKVTPYRKNKNNSLSAKERLSLNIINYKTECQKEFKTSHFWFKNSKLQLLWYLQEDKKDKKDCRITNQLLLELEKSEDLKQIEEDWNTVINKIRNGRAHELSEADTMYLAACTKGGNAGTIRTQPYSDIPAKQRAFCFKQSYMSQLVKKYIGDYSDVEKILKDTSESFYEFVSSVVDKYKNMSQKELMKRFHIDSKSKSLNSMLISRMFGVRGNLSKTDEFQKANMVPKTIRIEENGKIKESMSFPYFKFTDIINQDFEDSELRRRFETTKYMFFLFKKENGEYIFKGIKIWNMPEKEIDTHVKDLWLKTRDTIKSGNIVKEIKNGRRKTNFIGMRQNEVCHVRPHSRNAFDTCPLPVADKLTGAVEYTKHCFWINNKYIKKILEELIES